MRFEGRGSRKLGYEFIETRPGRARRDRESVPGARSGRTHAKLLRARYRLARASTTSERVAFLASPR